MFTKTIIGVDVVSPASSSLLPRPPPTNKKIQLEKTIHTASSIIVVYSPSHNWEFQYNINIAKSTAGRKAGKKEGRRQAQGTGKLKNKKN